MEKNRHQDRQGAVRRASVPLAAGASLASVAVVVCVVDGQVLGGGLLLSSSVLLLWGLHRLGRLGADPPTPLDG